MLLSRRPLRCMLALLCVVLLGTLLPSQFNPLPILPTPVYADSNEQTQTVTLTPQEAWQHTISGDAIVAATCETAGDQPTSIGLGYQRGTENAVGINVCSNRPQFVIRTNGQPVRITLHNGSPDTSYTVRIRFRSYNDMVIPASTSLAGLQTIELLPKQNWHYTVTGYAVVAASCSAPTNSGYNLYRIYLSYESPLGNQGRHCVEPAMPAHSFVVRAEGHQTTVRLSNDNEGYVDLRSVELDLRIYNDLERPPHQIPTDAESIELQPLQGWTQIISGMDVVAAKCRGTEVEAYRIYLNSIMGLDERGQGHCSTTSPNGAFFVLRADRKPITIRFINTNCCATIRNVGGDN